VQLNFSHTPANDAALLGLGEQVSHILTPLSNLAMTIFIPKLDTQTCSA
jgi:hypothetical protein